MVRFVLAVLAGTVISFAIAFMICMLFPWTAATAQSLPNDAIVTRAMYDNIPTTGVYLFPALSQDGKSPTMQDMEAWNSKAKAGPTGILYFARDGVDADGPAPLLKGLAIHLLASLLVAGLLALTAPSLRNYFARVLFVGALGVFATLTVFGLLWAVEFAPLSCFLAHLANNTITWLAAGLAMGALIRPAAPAPPA